jgi:hypothetical protein
MCVTGAEDVDPPGKGGEELSEHRVVGIRHGEIRIVRLLQAEAVISDIGVKLHLLDQFRHADSSHELTTSSAKP